MRETVLLKFKYLKRIRKKMAAQPSKVSIFNKLFEPLD